jgi:hypothetical protein
MKYSNTSRYVFCFLLLLSGMIIGWPDSAGRVNVYGFSLFMAGLIALMVWFVRNLE